MTTRATLPLYLVASATSLFGNSAISIVLPWLVLSRTGDPAVAGTVATMAGLPSAVAALVGGHLIDKLGRKRISVLSDIGSAVAVAALAVVDAAFGLNVAWFIVLGVLGALFDVPGMTARETLMANVAEASGTSLDKVASMRSSIFGLSFLAGPAIAGGLLAILPAIQVVWITAACSGLAAACIAVMPLPETRSDETGEHESPLAGWRIIADCPALVAMTVVSLGGALLVSPLLGIILPAHYSRLGQPGQLGLSLSSYAVGTILGSVLYGWVFANRRWASWVSSLVLYGISFALLATLGQFWVLVTGMAVAGIGSGLMQPITTVVLTEMVPDAVRGRVFGLLSALSVSVAPVGLGLMSALLAGFDLRWGAIALAVAWVPVLLYGAVSPGLRAHLRPGPAPSRAPAGGEGQ